MQTRVAAWSQPVFALARADRANRTNFFPAGCATAQHLRQPRFGLKTDEEKTILRGVFAAVTRWRETGLKLRLKAATLDAYESAFEHPLREEASKPLGQP